MKKKLILILACFTFLFGCAGVKQKPVDYTGLFEQSAAATKMYGRDTRTGGTKSCDNISSPVDGDFCFVPGDSNGYQWMYKFDDGSSESADDLPWLIDGTGGDWILINRPNAGGEIHIAATTEADRDITEDEWYQNKSFDNKGASSEGDWFLPDNYDYVITRIIMCSVPSINIEINPDSGGYITLDGTPLAQNYCVNSDSTVGSKIAVTRFYDDDDNRWEWDLTTISGVWTSCGGTSD